MFDGNNCCHSISDIRSCKIRILVLDDTDLSRITVHDSRKSCLKSCQVCTALCIVDVITEAQNILAEITGVLESHLYLDAVCLSLKVDRLMKCLRTVVQITDVSDDPLRLMVFQFLRLRTAQILEIDRQGRIQVCCLMETALDLCCRETGLLKDLRVRKEIDAGSVAFVRPSFGRSPSSSSMVGIPLS